MVRCYLNHVRIAMVSMALAAMMVAAAGTARAQCVCPTVRIDVLKDVACPVTICYRISPEGYTTCVAVAPGTSLTIPCGDWQDACVRLCGGGCYTLLNPAAARCSETLQVGPVCCVRVCHVQSPDEKCPHIEISGVALCLGQPCQ
ncbi:MAG: hypothetical protein JST22_12605 [Bacteroidetes bacterium]|nr:hypothetical protein [Bacteroidota bacterium]